MKPRIAVMIPCYNDGPVCLDAVASVAEREPIEIVVIDDGSTAQDTQRALATLPPHVALIRQANAGLSAARQAGLAATRARYVFPLDSDDLLFPNTLAALADVLDAHPDASFAYGDFEMCGILTGIRRTREWDPWALLYGNFWCPSLLFRRAALEEVGGWTWRDCAEDWALLLALAEAGHKGIHQEIVTHRYRIEPGRMYDRCRRRHGVWYRELRRRHAGLFARKRELRRESAPPAWQRFAYPLLLGDRRLFPPWLEDATLWMRGGGRRHRVPSD